MRGNMYSMHVCLLFASLCLWGCGRSGSTTEPAVSSPTTATTATGKFVDAPVEGLKYVSGEQNGFTGSSGEFTYEVGETVTFSVGGVVIGQAQGAGVITPIDLVKTLNPGATVTAATPAVVQIVQFLLSASSLTATGIRIDPSVSTACAAQSLNVSSAPPVAFMPVLNQIAAMAGNRPVTTAMAAGNHIAASLDGLSSGALVLPPVSSTGGGYGRLPHDIVRVYKSTGSTQCYGGGMPITAMEQQLTDAGVPILTSACGSDGVMHVAMCGAADGSIGIFEVPRAHEQAALALGFALLRDLPAAMIGSCTDGGPAASVRVYKYDGSTQCYGGGMSLSEMERQITDVGIQVLSSSCGKDGMVHTMECGGTTSSINIFEIPADQASAASELGFSPLSNLPGAGEVACR